MKTTINNQIIADCGDESNGTDLPTALVEAALQAMENENG